MPSQPYSKLQLLPLFQGMSNDDLTLLVGRTKLDFRKVSSQDVIVKADQPCQQLLFLIDGEVEVEGASLNRHYIITETMHAPIAIQPERLFGLEQHYNRTFTAITPCNILSISKQEVLRLLEEHMIFRFNLLNITAACVHRHERRLWQLSVGDLGQHITRFIAARCIRPAGEKHIRIKMNDLAMELGCSRLEVSKALHKLQDAGLLSISRNFIHIPHFEQLLKHF